MKRRIVCLLGLAALLFTVAAPVHSTELVYTPINPSFGGPSSNGGFLLGAAEAQNKHTEGSSSYRRDPIDSFEESLVRRILSNLAGEIVGQAFGDDESLPEGHYEFGDYLIDVNNWDGLDLTVTITDVGTGNETTIEVPQLY
ncbi:curli production assembly/transport component CsgF [uncultured Desulfuromonas sp.]|uniref:curli production assembly/transport component CsgF n=1 Tax=uncultured Desulfuromonas sp. TaxID=181013 RepID=UPI002621CE5C|nr:curli production assembly/transport component CsgF [uncultured Desulfuromonas sp.]